MLVSGVQQSESVMCTYSSSFFGFPSHSGHHRALSGDPVLYSKLSLLWSIFDINYGLDVSSPISFAFLNPAVLAPCAFWDLGVPCWVWAPEPV